MEELHSQIMQACEIIEQAAKQVPEAATNSKYDDVYWFLKAAINSLYDADCVLERIDEED